MELTITEILHHTYISSIKIEKVTSLVPIIQRQRYLDRFWGIGQAT